MEVNNISVLPYPCKKYVELPRKMLTDRLTSQEKEKMLELFVDDIKGLRDKLFKEKDGKTLLVLSEPLCDLETRERIFRDIIDLPILGPPPNMDAPEGRNPGTAHLIGLNTLERNA